MSVVALSSPSFTDRVLQLLQRVDYRRAESLEEREAIFRLRYEAYLREGAVAPNLARRFTDPVDDQENTWIFGVHIDGRLVSSIRLSVTVPGYSELPTAHVFPDLLLPHIAAGRTLVDPTRFVTDRASSRLHPELPHVTLRIPWLAMEYFNADLMLAAVRVEHQAFYKRLWGHQTVGAPRPYPNLQMRVGLMTLDYRAARQQVHRRYPFFQSNFFERRMLFERFAELSQRSAA